MRSWAHVNCGTCAGHVRDMCGHVQDSWNTFSGDTARHLHDAGKLYASTTSCAHFGQAGACWKIVSNLFNSFNIIMGHALLHIIFFPVTFSPDFQKC